MKVLFLTKYSDMGASSRYRTFQYLSYFDSRGISCTLFPLFGEDYLTSLYQKKRRELLIILKSALKRMMFIIFHATNYDLIVIEKELFPYFPAIFERYLFFRNVHYLLDYDDAVFHNYDQNKSKIIRLLLKNKIPTVIKKSNGITAGNDYLLEYARRYKPSKVYSVPTVIDLQKYSPKVWQNCDKFIIGWIGSLTTSENIVMLNKPLEKFCMNHNAIVSLVGFDKSLVPALTFPHEIISWEQGKESDEINRFSVGIMPLIDSSFNWGKCGFKLIQYHGCALPVIASPIGANKKIITHGANGFLAKSNDEWNKYLEILYGDKSLCRQMGDAGRIKIENEYSLDKTKREYYKIIYSAIHHD